MILYTILYILHELVLHKAAHIVGEQVVFRIEVERYVRQQRCCIIIQSTFRMYLQRRDWAKRLARHTWWQAHRRKIN